MFKFCDVITIFKIGLTYHVFLKWGDKIAILAASVPPFGPPSDDWDLSSQAYTTTVDISRDDWYSPVFDRTGAPYTMITIPTLAAFGERFWIIYSYYNMLEEQWKTVAFPDTKFSIILQHRTINHGSPGNEIISRCRVGFIQTTPSPSRFNCTISLEWKLYENMGGILTYSGHQK